MLCVQAIPYQCIYTMLVITACYSTGAGGYPNDTSRYCTLLLMHTAPPMYTLRRLLCNTVLEHVLRTIKYVYNSIIAVIPSVPGQPYVQ